MKKMLEKGKRILALAGVVVLLVLYAVTLVSAVMATPAAHGLFKTSLLATLVIPILLYVYLLVYRLIFGGKQEDEDEEQ